MLPQAKQQHKEYCAQLTQLHLVVCDTLFSYICICMYSRTLTLQISHSEDYRDDDLPLFIVQVSLLFAPSDFSYVLIQPSIALLYLTKCTYVYRACMHQP